MLNQFVPLVGSMLTNEFLDLMIYPLFAMYFVASVPGLIRTFTTWR